MIMAAENLERDQSEKLKFHQCVYFITVTLSTVGYGDLAPQTELGRLLVIIVIIMTIAIIPRQIGELLRLLGMQSVYEREIYKSNSEVPHIICTGQITFDALKNCCDDLFHEDHGIEAKMLVILQPGDPNATLELFLNGNKNKYEIYITFLNGDPLSKVDCIILTNKNSRDPQSCDHKNILIALGIKKYVYENSKDNKNSIRLCMQLIKPESKIHYLSSLKIPSNDQLIIVEEIKMNLLAKSCFAPGLIALLSNLTSSGDMDSSLFEKDWMRDYVQGLGFEIYRATLHYLFTDFQFKDIVKIIYKEYKSIVFALGIECQGRSIVVLNPSKYKCNDFKNNKYYLFMICEDASIAEEAETLENMARESRRKYFGVDEKIKLSKEDEFSDNQKKDVENVLGSFIEFDFDIDVKDYFILPKSQSQMDVTVTNTGVCIKNETILHKK